MNKDALRKMSLREHEQLKYLANSGNTVAVAILDELHTLSSPSVFEEAESLIFGDREKTHGDPSKNLARIAELWNQFLQRRFREAAQAVCMRKTGLHLSVEQMREATSMIDLGITITDVCRMMQLLKWSRDENHPLRDNIVDDMGYAGLIQRCREPVEKTMAQGIVSDGRYKDLEQLGERKPPKRAQTTPKRKTKSRKAKK